MCRGGGKQGCGHDQLRPPLGGLTPTGLCSHLLIQATSFDLNLQWLRTSNIKRYSKQK